MMKDESRIIDDSALIDTRLAGKARGRYRKIADMPPELTEGIRQGREDAYNKLYLHFADPLMDFVKCYGIGRHDAEEIVQEVFTYIWVKKDTLDPARNIKGLLYTCAKNYCLDYFRRKKVMQKYLAFTETGTGDELPVDENYIARETRLRIDVAIERMPPVRRKVFLMNKYEDLSVGEIAKKMNVREQVVRRHIVSAKEDIEKILFVVLMFLVQ